MRIILIIYIIYICLFERIYTLCHIPLLSMNHFPQLAQSCKDILFRNLNQSHESVYILYDTESPLAKILSNAFLEIAPTHFSISREFVKPPQPLYRWGLINPDNPYAKEQNKVVTSHNIVQNKELWLDHHEKWSIVNEDHIEEDPQIEVIKNELLSLPKWSIVVLIQSTNFRLSTFRIRLELFHRGIHVIEFNHLAYIQEQEFDTFIHSLEYRTDFYIALENALGQKMHRAESITLESNMGDKLIFGPVETIRGNTGDYRWVENKWGTFPIGEVFTEARDLSSVSGTCRIEAFPNEDFSVNHTAPFLLTIKNGRVLPSSDFPSSFQKLYDWIMEFEWEVLVRELWFWLNPAITRETPLSDINFYERKTGVHLSLGKKHGIYGKKLPKSEIQRFHIDVFLDIKSVSIDNDSVFDGSNWRV